MVVQPTQPQRMQFSRFSLALRVLLTSIVVIAVPLLLFFFYVYEREYATRLEAMAVRLHDLGKSRAELMSQLTRHDLKTIDIIEEIIKIEDPDLPALNSLLFAMATGGGYAEVYYVAALPGEQYKVVAASNPKLVGSNLSQDRYIEDVLVDGETSFLAHGAALDIPTSTFKKYFYVAKSIEDGRGILTLQTAVNELVNAITSPLSSPYPVQFSLVTRDGDIFTSSDQQLILRSVAPLEQSGSSAIKDLPGAMLADWAGAERIVVKIPIQGTDLSLLLSAKERDVFQPLRDRMWHVLGIFTLIFVVGGWTALWLTLRMSQPMRRLGEVMNRVSEGDLTARYTKQRSGFEINVIGALFNETIDSLRNQMARAEAERIRRETLDEEFRIGREIQMAILPDVPPPSNGVALAARYLPAKQVGGDFYDIFSLDHHDGSGQDLVLTVADASGKGISACLYALLLRSMVRSFVVTHRNVSDALRHANNLFCEDTGATGMFVTAFTAIYCPQDKRLAYTSCGHLPGLIYRANGDIEALEVGGMALGVLPMEDLDESQVQLAAGDLLVLYSDGITEAHNRERKLYGQERLVAYLKSTEHASVDALADGILHDVERFCADVSQSDDITLLLLQVE